MTLVTVAGESDSETGLMAFKEVVYSVDNSL
jgi:hypothetical protein